MSENLSGFAAFDLKKAAQAIDKLKQAMNDFEEEFKKPRLFRNEKDLTPEVEQVRRRLSEIERKFGDTLDDLYSDREYSRLFSEGMLTYKDVYVEAEEGLILIKTPRLYSRYSHKYSRNIPSVGFDYSSFFGRDIRISLADREEIVRSFDKKTITCIGVFPEGNSLIPDADNLDVKYIIDSIAYGMKGKDGENTTVLLRSIRSSEISKGGYFIITKDTPSEEEMLEYMKRTDINSRPFFEKMNAILNEKEAEKEEHYRLAKAKRDARKAELERRKLKEEEEFKTEKRSEYKKMISENPDKKSKLISSVPDEKWSGKEKKSR